MDLYGDQLRKPHTTLVECHFDEYFDQQLRELENSALSQDNRAPESSLLADEEPSSFSKIVGNEPPPLPGLLSRGMRLVFSHHILC